MPMLMYILSGGLGFALGWLGYDIAKATFNAVTKRGAARHRLPGLRGRGPNAAEPIAINTGRNRRRLVPPPLKSLVGEIARHSRDENALRV
jgi:hypothetical protein